MKQAYFIYKCRRCGEKYASAPAIPEDKAPAMLQDVADRKESSVYNTFNEVRKELIEVHVCGVSGYGIADLLGFSIIEEKE